MYKMGMSAKRPQSRSAVVVPRPGRFVLAAADDVLRVIVLTVEIGLPLAVANSAPAEKIMRLILFGSYSGRWRRSSPICFEFGLSFRRFLPIRTFGGGAWTDSSWATPSRSGPAPSAVHITLDVRA
jgi:hypothetical protein